MDSITSATVTILASKAISSPFNPFGLSTEIDVARLDTYLFFISKSNNTGAASGAPTNRISPVGALLAAPYLVCIKI